MADDDAAVSAAREIAYMGQAAGIAIHALMETFADKRTLPDA
jgi:hypothetical protein